MPSQEELAVETRRLTAPEIFSAAVENAREELRRPARSLAFSGLAGGLTMGLTGLSVAAVRAILGSGTWEELVSFVVYPVGFIAVIIGRAVRKSTRLNSSHVAISYAVFCLKKKKDNE